MYKKGFDREEAIRLEAYLLSEKAGHPAGMESVFWAHAEALLNRRPAKSAPKRKAASKPAKAKRPAKKKA